MTKQHDSSQSESLERLIGKLDLLATMIGELAKSNSELVQALMDIADEGQGEQQAGLYLDGTKAPR